MRLAPWLTALLVSPSSAYGGLQGDLALRAVQRRLVLLEWYRGVKWC